MAPAESGDHVFGHDYDPISDAVVAWRLTPGTAVTQPLTVPVGSVVDRLAVKLRRSSATTGATDDGAVGRGPGMGPALRYRLSTPDSTEIAAGSVPSAVGTLAEQWVWLAPDEPLSFSQNRALRLTLDLPATATDGYEWFGTASRPPERPELAVYFGYDPAWAELDLKRPTAFENAINLDLGARTPRYGDDSVIDGSGQRIDGVSLAFLITAPGHADHPPAQPFDFVATATGGLPDGPPRRADVVARDDELVLDDSWATPEVPAIPLLQRAAEEFTAFLRGPMAVTPAGHRPIRLELVEDDAGRGAEAFTLDIGPDAILGRAATARGLLHALHHLESTMRSRRAPLLPLGPQVREPRWPVRITCAAFGTGEELDRRDDAYTDGLLGRISRAGFNGIWMLAELERTGRSAVYPELDHGVAARQAKLRDLVSRAAVYGIDVYLHLESRPQPAAFFERHPGARGSTFHGYGGEAVLCTGADEVRRHLAGSVADLVDAVPGLGGLMILIGGEGFLHCHTRSADCPRCGPRPPAEVVAELTGVVTEAVHRDHPAVTVAAWPYSASNWWSADDPFQHELITRLPAGATLLTEFAKEGRVRVGETAVPAYDYPISILGPSDRFVAQAAQASARGTELWVKTEHAIALELITVPYLPVFARWRDRFTLIAGFPAVRGVLANWMHYGFVPGRATDLFASITWAADGDADPLTMIAERDFGLPAATAVVCAWTTFGEAIADYPFSAPLALGPIQSGPAHPLFLDPQLRPWHGAERQFANDLSWTEPWGPEAALGALSALADRWSQGLDELGRAATLVAEADVGELTREVGVATCVQACVRSTINVGRFFQAREQLFTAGDERARRTALAALIRVAGDEDANCREVLPFLRADSRLGYANSARSAQQGVPRGGMFGPVAVEKKLRHLDRVRAELARLAGTCRDGDTTEES